MLGKNMYRKSILATSRVGLTLSYMDDVVLLDTRGFLTEGRGANLFLVRGGTLYTPSEDVLWGITRETVIQLAAALGFQVTETLIPRELLYIADEVFFSGTAAEITPIRSVDRVQVGEGARGPINGSHHNRLCKYISPGCDSS